MFLPVVILVYYFAKPSLRNYVLLVFSLIFYAWGEPVYIFVMISSIVANYALALLIAKSVKHPLISKAFLILAIIANLSLLGYYKYADFFIDTLNTLLVHFSGFQLVSPVVTLPIGISFYTFQAMSYVIDVYRKQVEATPKITKVALYISLFPQLIAGPIVRYIDIERQLENREVHFSSLVAGMRRFIVGLAKKVLIANALAEVADGVFALNMANLTTSIAWLGVFCYSLQLYFDFSGYSDMAIGLGKMFGFTFLENFNYPYIAKSITDFWRRWHLSLSSWFRDYLYIPLGGNRRGKFRTYVNLVVVFFCTGLWHGASWNFVFWGLYHGLFLIIEKMCGRRDAQYTGQSPVGRGVASAFSHMGTLFVVLIGWVFFRAETLGATMAFLGRMFAITSAETAIFSLLYYLNARMVFILIAAMTTSIPIRKIVLSRWRPSTGVSAVASVLYDLSLIILLLFSIMALSSSTYNPFIYFRF